MAAPYVPADCNIVYGRAAYTRLVYQVGQLACGAAHLYFLGFNLKV